MRDRMLKKNKKRGKRKEKKKMSCKLFVREKRGFSWTYSLLLSHWPISPKKVHKDVVHPQWWQGWPWPLECWRCLLWKDIASLKCSSVLLQEEELGSHCLSPEFHPPCGAGHHEVAPCFLPTLVQRARKKLFPLHLWLVQGFQWLISEKLKCPEQIPLGCFQGKFLADSRCSGKNPHLKKKWEIPTTFKADSTPQCRD